jgi:hypothetical protein
MRIFHRFIIIDYLLIVKKSHHISKKQHIFNFKLQDCDLNQLIHNVSNFTPSVSVIPLRWEIEVSRPQKCKILKEFMFHTGAWETKYSEQNDRHNKHTGL